MPPPPKSVTAGFSLGWNQILCFVSAVLKLLSQLLDSYLLILYCVCFNLFCDVWLYVCVLFVICGCFGNMCTYIYYVFILFVLCFLYCSVYVYLFLSVLSVLL